MNEETEITGNEPKKESAMMAPMTGKKLVEPLITFETWAASMLFTLNS